MLFSALACFSPFVPAEIRKLWVHNGGKLTHTPTQFFEATMFFCNGMDDPWLGDLLQRRIIVRHAAWIEVCVEENFIMPIAAYTLDDDFDADRISRSSSTQIAVAAEPIVPPNDLQSKQAAAPPVHEKGESVSGRNNRSENLKRRRSQDEDLYSSMHMRPSKRFRMPARSFPSVEALPKSQLSVLSRVIGFAQVQKKSKAASQLPSVAQKQADLLRRFAEDLKRQHKKRQVCSTPCSNVNLTPRISPQCYSIPNKLHTTEDAANAAPVRIAIEDLVRTPYAEATKLELGRTYLGRKFTLADPGLGSKYT